MYPRSIEPCGPAQNRRHWRLAPRLALILFLAETLILCGFPLFFCLFEVMLLASEFFSYT